jgi:hypothetical protein
MKFTPIEFSYVKELDVSLFCPVERFEKQARCVIDILYGCNTMGVNDTRVKISLEGIEWITNETD